MRKSSDMSNTTKVEREQDNCKNCGGSVLWGSLATEADRQAWLAEHKSCPPREKPEVTPSEDDGPKSGKRMANKKPRSAKKPAATDDGHPDWCTCKTCKVSATAEPVVTEPAITEPTATAGLECETETPEPASASDFDTMADIESSATND